MLEKLIVMLTHNDKTVPDAAAVFEQCKDLPVTNWGFKDVGMQPEKMKELCHAMKKAGKTTFLEVVTYSEEECLRGAKLAVECGFDYLLGTLMYESVAKYTIEQGIKYLPFVGKVSGSPSILEGNAADMVAQAEAFKKVGAYGTDLLGYRYVDGDPEALAAEFIKKSPIPTVLAGSISSIAKLEKVKAMDPWLFTMGSALFTANFVPGGNVYDNLAEVCNILKKM